MNGINELAIWYDFRLTKEKKQWTTATTSTYLVVDAALHAHTAVLHAFVVWECCHWAGPNYLVKVFHDGSSPGSQMKRINSWSA